MTRALKGSLVDFLVELNALLDKYADADMSGDPPRYHPNRAMQLQMEAKMLVNELLEEPND